MLKKSRGKRAIRRSTVIKRVCIVSILIPLSYKKNPIISIKNARKSEGGESKKSR
jgi:hypothetical protein